MKTQTMGVLPGRALSEVPPPPEKPKYGIVLFGLILAGAYLILGGKKN